MFGVFVAVTCMDWEYTAPKLLLQDTVKGVCCKYVFTDDNTRLASDEPPFNVGYNEGTKDTPCTLFGYNDHVVFNVGMANTIGYGYVRVPSID